jgi:hypothetical protein
LLIKQTFISPHASTIRQFHPSGNIGKLLIIQKKNEFANHFEHIFITCSYRIGIGLVFFLDTNEKVFHCRKKYKNPNH